MNAILAICSEYSDNVWYSGIDNDSTPSKIAIEIEREYRFGFMKVMARAGYKLDSLRRSDNENVVLTLVKIEKNVLC